MEMVRHHDPCKEVIALTIKMMKGSFYDLSQIWIFQKARTMPRIDPVVQALPTLDRSLFVGDGRYNLIDTLNSRLWQAVG